MRVFGWPQADEAGPWRWMHMNRQSEGASVIGMRLEPNDNECVVHIDIRGQSSPGGRVYCRPHAPTWFPATAMPNPWAESCR
jgi:hypothetical protein